MRSDAPYREEMEDLQAVLMYPPSDAKGQAVLATGYKGDNPLVVCFVS